MLGLQKVVLQVGSFLFTVQLVYNIILVSGVQHESAFLDYTPLKLLLNNSCFLQWSSGITNVFISSSNYLKEQFCLRPIKNLYLPPK